MSEAHTKHHAWVLCQAAMHDFLKSWSESSAAYEVCEVGGSIETQLLSSQMLDCPANTHEIYIQRNSNLNVTLSILFSAFLPNQTWIKDNLSRIERKHQPNFSTMRFQGSQTYNLSKMVPELEKTTVSQFRRLQAETDWEEQRRNITQLYRTQNLKIYEVIHVMKQQHRIRIT